MSILVNTPWRNIKALSVGGTTANSFGNYGNVSTSTRLIVYSGTMPDPSVWNVSFNLATYAANVLVGWTSFNLSRTNNTIGFGSTPPTPTNATGTGTATWCVLCYGPTSYTTGTTSEFVIGNPSLTGSNGLLQLNTLNIVAGSSITPINFSLLF
jgi:hypothetical protein